MVELHVEEHTRDFSSGNTITYGKLILATASVPKKPAWLKGQELKHAYAISKTKVTLQKIEKQVLNSALDPEFGKIAKEHLVERGVNVFTCEGLLEISSIGELQIPSASIFRPGLRQSS